MAPEIFKKSTSLSFLAFVLIPTRAVGHGKPVDVWAMGVITYFLLAGNASLYISMPSVDARHR